MKPMTWILGILIILDLGNMKLLKHLWLENMRCKAKKFFQALIYQFFFNTLLLEKYELYVKDKKS